MYRATYFSLISATAAHAASRSQASAPAFASLDSAAGLATWRVANANGSIDVAATVPGLIHLDLLGAGVISEPYAGLNVDVQHWVAEEPAWTWTATFASMPELAGKRHVELVAEGIDAVADVSLNGARVWSGSSAFMRYVAPVALADGANNTLVVYVQSPLTASAAAFAACPSEPGAYCPPLASDGNASAVFQGVNYVRRAPVSFGWDFAPNFAPSGVWRSMFLRGYDDAVADEVTVVTTPMAPPSPAAASAWVAVFTVYATAAADGVAVVARVEVDLGGGNTVAGEAAAVLSAGSGNAVNVTISFPAVQSWWPSGFGGQPVSYPATASIAVNSTGEAWSLAPFPLTFKSVALHTPSAPDGNGKLYYFDVNGQPFFAKGSNWVPNDAQVRIVDSSCPATTSLRPAHLLPSVFPLSTHPWPVILAARHPQILCACLREAAFRPKDGVIRRCWLQRPSRVGRGAPYVHRVLRERSCSRVASLARVSVRLFDGPDRCTDKD